MHQACLYKNASSALKGNPCEAKVGDELNANIIACYRNGLDTSVYANSSDDVWDTELQLRINRSKSSQPHCENPKCNSVAETRFSGEIFLCFKCVDLLREWKTNHELGTIFRRKNKLVKLFKLIDEQINQPKKEMVRCSNIYCGTVDNMTRHHLIPKPFRNRQTVEKIPLCEPCHKRVHQLATNTELAKSYNTKRSVVELLANDVKFRVQRMINVCQSENLLAVA